MAGLEVNGKTQLGLPALVFFPASTGLRGWCWRFNQLGDKDRERHDVFVLARLFQGVHVLVTARDWYDGPWRSALGKKRIHNKARRASVPVREWVDIGE